MKEKKIALFGFMVFAIFFLISSFVNADLDTGLIRYYSMDNNNLSGTTLYDLTGNDNAVLTNVNTGIRGAATNTEESIQSQNGDTSYIGSWAVTKAQQDNSHTWAFWLNSTTNTSKSLFTTKCTANFAAFFDADGLKFQYYDGSIVDNVHFEVGANEWHHIVVTRNNTDTDLELVMYKDGVKVASADYAGGALQAKATQCYIFRNDGAGFFINAHIDEFMFYDRAISPDEVSLLYNSGDFCNPLENPTGCPITGGSPPSITLNTNLSSNTNSTAYPFFFSIDAIGNVVNTTDLWNISVYLNGTLNQTHLNVALNVTKFVINLTYGYEQTAYDINVSVRHGYDTATDSFVRTKIFLDSVSPTINLLQPSQNNSIKFKGVDTLFNISIFCADPNLFSCNLTFYNLTENKTLDTLLNSTIAQSITTGNQTLTLANNVAKLSIGQYAIIAEAADSHTAIDVSDMIWDWQDNKLYIANLIFEGTDLKSTNNQGNLVTYFYKDFDRYKMKVTFNSQALSHEFILTAPQWQYVGAQYGFKGHFVSLSERKWLDFMGQNVEDVIVTPIGNDQYLIHVDHYTLTDEIEFESIGDLNTVKQIYYMNVSQNNFAFNMFIKDEDNPTTPLIGTAEVEFNYYIGNSPNITNYYADLSGSDNYAFNISTNESTITGDLYIKYTTANGFTHRYIIVNTTFNTTQGYNFTLYNFNTTTGISDLKITARQNSNYNYYPDVIAKLQRRYTSEGLWRTVQMDQSGDFGVIFFNVREETTDYRIIFTDLDNNILKTTDSLKFICTDGFCDLTTLLDPYTAASVSTDITASFIYDNSTNLLNFTWTDAEGGSNTVRMRARQDTITGAIYPCDQTQAAAASGTYSCNLTGRQGALEVTVIANGDIILNEWIEINVGKIGAQIDEREGAFWAALIMVVCVTFGLFSPVGAIITMVIGLILVSLLGIFTPLSMTFIIISTVIGILIGFKVKQ